MRPRLRRQTIALGALGVGVAALLGACADRSRKSSADAACTSRRCEPEERASTGASSSPSSLPIALLEPLRAVPVTSAWDPFGIPTARASAAAVPLSLGAPEPQALAKATIDIAPDGKVWLDGKGPTDVSAVTPWVLAHKVMEPDLHVVLRADASTPHHVVIDVIDSVKKGGVSKVVFAVAPGDPTAAPSATTGP